jgi:hypothetical protein
MKNGIKSKGKDDPMTGFKIQIYKLQASNSKSQDPTLDPCT